MFLYHTKLTDKKIESKRCEFSIGMLCQNHETCISYLRGMKGKNERKIHNTYEKKFVCIA